MVIHAVNAQGRQGPRAALERGVAGDAARLLALAQADAPTCFPYGCIATASSRLPTRSCGVPCTDAVETAGIRQEGNAPPGLPQLGHRICWKPVPTLRTTSSFCFLVMKIWRPRPGICICPNSTCTRVANPIEELKLSSVDQSRRLYHRPLRAHDPAGPRSGRYRPCAGKAVFWNASRPFSLSYQQLKAFRAVLRCRALQRGPRRT